MSKVWLVFQREYLATVKTKSFLAALVLMPLLGLVSMAMPLLAREHQPEVVRRCAVVDRTGQLFSTLSLRASERNARQKERFEFENVPPARDAIAQGRELSEQVRQGRLFAFIELEGRILDPSGETAIHYYTATPTHLELPRWIRETLEGAVHELRLKREGVDATLVARAQTPVRLAHARLYERQGDPSPSRLDDVDPLKRAGTPIAIAVIMFISVVMGASPLMQSVLEEKMYRIAEVLMASVPPFELMLGKLLGACAVSYTLLGIYGLGGWFVASRLGVDLPLSAGDIAWVLTFQTIALLLYGSLFLAVGAACSDLKQSQTLMMPVMLLAMSPMLLLPFVVGDPNGSLSTAFSFFPFFSPLLMMLRVTLPPGVPAWHAAIGAGLSGVLALVCTAAAARVFKVGMLSQGAAPSLGELWSWVRDR